MRTSATECTVLARLDPRRCAPPASATLGARCSFICLWSGKESRVPLRMYHASHSTGYSNLRGPGSEVSHQSRLCGSDADRRLCQSGASARANTTAGALDLLQTPISLVARTLPCVEMLRFGLLQRLKSTKLRAHLSAPDANNSMSI